MRRFESYGALLSACVVACLLRAAVGPLFAAGPVADVTASKTAAGFAAAGVLDGDRFSCDPGSMWQGDAKSSCYWQLRFTEPVAVGAILQINSDDEHRLRNAPRSYMWQYSDDGVTWSRIPRTVVRRIMGNFLQVARQWQQSRPSGARP